MQSAILEVVPNGHKNRKRRMARHVFLQGVHQIKGLPETDHKSNPKKNEAGIFTSMTFLVRFAESCPWACSGVGAT